MITSSSTPAIFSRATTFGGKLLQCRIGGTTGMTAPTDADRMPGQIYSSMANSKYLQRRASATTTACIPYTQYRTSGYDDVKFDGTP